MLQPQRHWGEFFPSLLLTSHPQQRCVQDTGCATLMHRGKCRGGAHLISAYSATRSFCAPDPLGCSDSSHFSSCGHEQQPDP